MPADDQNRNTPSIRYKNTKLRDDISLDSAQIMSIDVYESLIYPGITGELSYRDYHDLIENNNIFAGDDIDLEIEFRDRGLHIDKNNYAITGFKQGNNADQVYNEVLITFETKWSTEASTRKLIEPLATRDTNRRIDEMVTYIVEELCGGQMGIVVQTKGVYDSMTLPTWSLLDVLNYLMSFALSDSTLSTQGIESGGYCLWTDLTSGKVNFAPIDYLTFGSDGTNTYGTSTTGDLSALQGYNFDDKTVNELEAITTDDTLLKVETEYEHDYSHIRDVHVEQAFDIIDIINNGANHTRFVGFNYDENRVLEEEITINHFTANHISEGFPMPNKYIGSNQQFSSKEIYVNDYRSARFSSMYPNTNNLIVSDSSADSVSANQHVKGRLYTKFSNLFCDQIKINTVSVGDPYSKKVGRQVQINIPSAGKTQDAKNLHLSGTYIVRNNRHRFAAKYYINALTLMGDGFKTNGLEGSFTEWEGTDNTNI